MTAIDRLTATGIRRRGSARLGFRYRTASGRAVSAHDRARIAALRIPPAWTGVLIAPRADAALQAIGRDAAGRWQYRYHDRQTERRERRKHDRLIRFLGALPAMRRTVERHIALPGLPRERVLAGTLTILSTCFLRPGSECYVTENGSFGIATLRPRHVRVRGSRVSFDFRGKSGQRQQGELTDRRLARLVRDLLRHPGEVFKFRDDDGRLCDVKRRHINAYIKEVMGEAFSAKDFRTWAANLLFASAWARAEAEAHAGGDGATPASRRRVAAAALREVAGHLGNTPAVCRASYVFGSLITRLERGAATPATLGGLAPLARSRSMRVARAERTLSRLLRTTPGATRSPTARRSRQTPRSSDRGHRPVGLAH